MRLFRRSEPEIRESSFTDELVRLIVSRAGGATLAVPAATAALEAVSGLVGRSFAAATVDAPDDLMTALSPACMAMLGRTLIRSGEFVALIRVSRRGEVQLLPSFGHDVTGGPDPSTWQYRIHAAGPSGYQITAQAPAAGVVHVRYSSDPERPWKGVAPLDAATLAGRLSANVTGALADETGGPRGHLLPVPGKDGADPTLESLRADLRKLNGSVALVESMAGDWGQGDSRNAPRGDWEQKRIGASPPAALVELARLAFDEALSALGVSPALFSASDAGAAREAYRQSHHSLVAPLGRLAAVELSRAFETTVGVSFEQTGAADIASRARAFQSLVGGGMDVDRATALSGLIMAEDE